MKPAGRAATLSDLERNGADDDDATYDREDGWMLDARQPYPHRTQDVFQLGDQGHVDSRDEPRAQREEKQAQPHLEDAQQGCPFRVRDRGRSSWE